MAEPHADAFTVPVHDRYFEDYTPGIVATYGHIEMTEDAILDFARQFDPQSMHTDPTVAANGPFGGLIASGWHTSAVMMRIIADHYLNSASSLASPGVDELRWLKPVRPGDTLAVRFTVLRAVPSRSKPDRGVVYTGIEVLNQHDDAVMTVTTMNLVRRRPR
jgi:acyl dehydratase